MIEFPNKRTVKLKFKGDHFDLLPWESVELKTKKNDKALSRKMVTQNLIQERDDLIAEFTPLFHQYKQIVNSARWRETFNLFYQYLMLGTIGDLIFFHIGWDTMEPVTFVLFQCFLMLSAAFFFDQNAHYVSCSRKLRMMRRMHLLSKRRHFDLHHFRRISDRLFRIEDKLQSNIEPSARPLIDHCR